MLPKISLLEELKNGGYEASLVTTYNAYLPFYEEVVLRRLISAGVRHNVLLMDARQYAVSLASHPPRLAGRQYTLLPIKVGGAFHPKLVFLAGKHKGLVLVGSHNITLAGFGFNRELTNLVRIQGAGDAAGIALASDVWTEIDYWLAQCADGIPEHVKAMVWRIRDFAPWLKTEGAPDPNLRLLAGRPGGRSLWDQFRAMLDGEPVQVSISGPFFDRELRFLDRLRQDVQPAKLTIAIDPKTVQIPAKARTLEGVSLVQATRLGADDKEEESSRYLHAKGLLVQQSNGGTLLAVGSANPSAPAWLASETSGNIELMLARRDEDARAAAQALGFADIPHMPLLEEGDWQTIEDNAQEQADPAPLGYRSGLAVVEDDRVLFDTSLLKGHDGLEFVLYADHDREIGRERRFQVEGRFAILAFAAADTTDAVALHGLVGDQLALQLLLHHVRAIEDQARTGTQRRFKEALLSLETDTPNIEILIQCIDKIVFSEDGKTAAAALRQAGKRERPTPGEVPDPGTLAIDVTDMKKRKIKHRLNHSGDFAYLLDTLIYHLRLPEGKSVEELDRFGRNEEEQIGQDDEQDAEALKAIIRKQEEILQVCHAKVHTVVNRMIAQLEAYMKGNQTLVNVTVMLLGVLAVLRELRGCDGRVAWVEKGKTTVPEPQRLRLLEGIMVNLFEPSEHTEQAPLLHLEPLGEAFYESDDVARLKGLVLWLAWDCGLTLDLNKPFKESREDLKQRLRRNAMVLALAQMIRADAVVIEEAWQSIGRLTSTEMTWIAEIQQLADQCASLRQRPSGLYPAQKAEPGDIAIHRSLDSWDLRVVASYAENRLYLIRFSKDGKPKAYRPQYLAVARLTNRASR
jgi:hypothetical protein